MLINIDNLILEIYPNQTIELDNLISHPNLILIEPEPEPVKKKHKDV
jgi:hypothetical protein